MCRCTQQLTATDQSQPAGKKQRRCMCGACGSHRPHQGLRKPLMQLHIQPRLFSWRCFQSPQQQQQQQSSKEELLPDRTPHADLVVTYGGTTTIRLVCSVLETLLNDCEPDSSVRRWVGEVSSLWGNDVISF